MVSSPLQEVGMIVKITVLSDERVEVNASCDTFTATIPDWEKVITGNRKNIRLLSNVLMLKVSISCEWNVGQIHDFS